MSRSLYRSKWVLRVVLLLALAVGASFGARAFWRSAQKDDIYAAVFRYRFEHEFSKLLDSAVFYISIDDRDADERLMRQLRGTRPEVRKASEWKDPPGGGRRIGLWDLAWAGNAEATLSWGTPVGSMAIWGYRCRVVRSAGRWQVAEITHTYIADLGSPRRP